MRSCYSNPKRPRGSRAMNVGSREEYFARLRYSIKDAREALHNAVDMSDWDNAAKYITQIKRFERQLFEAGGDLPADLRMIHSRTPRWQKMGLRWTQTAGMKYGRGKLPR